MGLFQLKKETKINASLEQVWDFISSPINLKEITPPSMGFDIISDNYDQKIYPGRMIAYKVKPLWGLRTTWVTEITHVKIKEYFVDEQRIGPYKLWHHEHFIEEIEGGVLMTDIVSYQPPLGILGRLMNWWVIESKLADIFRYREKAVEKKFGQYTST